MKSKSILIALAFLLSLFDSTAEAAPAWFANLQLEITGVMPLGLTQEGLRADVTFDGSAGGPHIKNGTVVGVDHAVFDSSGNAHLNVYLTITDKDDDQISANITGLATFRNPGQYLLQGASGTIINEPDPNTGALHATTGKYAHLVDGTFTDVGFISAFSFDPAAGSVHAKWYLHDDVLWRKNVGTTAFNSGIAIGIPEPPTFPLTGLALMTVVACRRKHAGFAPTLDRHERPPALADRRRPQAHL